jgi:hypothetical protein
MSIIYYLRVSLRLIILWERIYIIEYSNENSIELIYFYTVPIS